MGRLISTNITIDYGNVIPECIKCIIFYNVYCNLSL